MKLHHIGLFTNNKKKMLNFYQRKLGMRKEYQVLLVKDIVRQIFGLNKDCYMAKLTLKDFCVELFWLAKGKLKVLSSERIGINHFSIKVLDKVSFCNRYEKNCKKKSIKVPRDGYCVYFIKDPDGNLIEVKE